MVSYETDIFMRDGKLVGCEERSERENNHHYSLSVSQSTIIQTSLSGF